MNDTVAILAAALLAFGVFLMWVDTAQGRRARGRTLAGAGLALVYAELAVGLVGFGLVVTALVAAKGATACWTTARRMPGRVLARVGWRRIRPRRRVETMSDRDWIGYVRRDVRVTTELAAVAEAAMRSMQETGGTPFERAGVLRIIGMARMGGQNALEAVERRERFEGVGGTG